MPLRFVPFNHEEIVSTAGYLFPLQSPRTIIYRKQDVYTVVNRLDEGNREKSLQQAVKFCGNLRHVLLECQKSLEEIEQIYAEKW